MHDEPAVEPQERMRAGVARTYATEAIEIEWEPRLCIHVAECFRRLPGVFDPRAKPWVRPEAADADAIAETVMRCPSGALRFRRLDGGPQETDLIGETQVLPFRNGPLEVRGKLTLTDARGNPVRELTRATLCRCGHSRNKPHCDNSHIAARFRDGTERVPRS
jgi:uncharacterized Fe-S cluster protein YjdI/CDGSH-type Zn-finger protein